MAGTFVGIGFGPIQSGLFLLEAYESGNFDRLVVAEVATDVVEGVRQSGGRYSINVAESDAVRMHRVEGLEIFNPEKAADLTQLISAIAAASEIATALPSVEFFDRGSPSTAELLAEGFRSRLERGDSRQTVVYAAENHNRAAELLREQVHAVLQPDEGVRLDDRMQFLNTVIGKMSGVVTDPEQIGREGLQPLVTSVNHAVLVEQFNSILIGKIQLPDFQRGLGVFHEKPDLLPFEEAKLYGHNAAHALMGYLAHRQGLRLMSEVRNGELLELVEQAFLEESGTTLCSRHDGIDPLFTEAGWADYVQDLLLRMTNPFLQDQVDRVIRDPRRKLGWDDRLIGTMRLALQYGVQPWRYSLGAAAAVELLRAQQPDRPALGLLEELWSKVDTSTGSRDAVIDCIREALED